MSWWIGLRGISIGIGVSTGVGVGAKGGSWEESLAWATLTTGGTYALTHPVQSARFFSAGARWSYPLLRRPIIDLVIRPGGFVIRGTAGGLWRGGVSMATSTTGIYVGAVAAGYVIGAITGTVIAEQIWGEKGKAEAIEFYTGKGHYWEQGEKDTPGFFNAPGNVELIWDHYFPEL